MAVSEVILDLDEEAGKEHPERFVLQTFRARGQRTCAFLLHGKDRWTGILAPTPWCTTKLVGVRIRILDSDPGAEMILDGPFTIEPRGARTRLLPRRPASEASDPGKIVRLSPEVVSVPGQDPIEIDVENTGTADALCVVEAILAIIDDRAFMPDVNRERPASKLDRVLVPFSSPQTLAPGTWTQLHTRPCGWARLRLVGLVLTEFHRVPWTTVEAQDFRIGGSPNLFHDDEEALLDSQAIFPRDKIPRFRLRAEPLLLSPNQSEISVRGVSFRDGADLDRASFRLAAICAVMEEIPSKDGSAIKGALAASFPRGAKKTAFSWGEIPDEDLAGIAIVRFGRGADGGVSIDGAFRDDVHFDEINLGDRIDQLRDHWNEILPRK